MCLARGLGHSAKQGALLCGACAGEQVCVLVCACTRACVHVHLCVRARVCTIMCVRAHVRTSMCMCSCVCVPVCAPPRTCSSTHTLPCLNQRTRFPPAARVWGAPGQVSEHRAPARGGGWERKARPAAPAVPTVTTWAAGLAWPPERGPRVAGITEEEALSTGTRVALATCQGKQPGRLAPAPLQKLILALAAGVGEGGRAAGHSGHCSAGPPARRPQGQGGPGGGSCHLTRC